MKFEGTPIKEWDGIIQSDGQYWLSETQFVFLEKGTLPIFTKTKDGWAVEVDGTYLAVQSE